MEVAFCRKRSVLPKDEKEQRHWLPVKKERTPEKEEAMVWLKSAIVVLALSQTGVEPRETVLLDFQAPWCGPCQRMQPVVESLAAKGYPVRAIDKDQNPDLARRYGVTGIPCFIMLRDGKEVDRVVGATSYQRLVRMYDAAGFRPLDLGNTSPPARESAAGIPARHSASDVGGTPRPVPKVPAMPVSYSDLGNETAPADADWEQYIAASVRLRVEDPSGHSCGTGTIIDSRQGQALVLTCGHIFRDSKGKGRIDVDLFGPNQGTTLDGRLVTYDLKRDLALLSITVPGRVAVCPVAPSGYTAAPGDSVVNVGCNNGATPTARDSRILSLDKYLGPPNVQVSGVPVVGRSGGGLFSTDGYVIGVCNAADPQDQEGLYASLPSIHELLDSVKLSFVYQDVAKSPRAVVAADVETAEQSLAAAEEAALRELDRRRREGAEVICIIRDPANPGGKSEIFVLNDASPAFLRALAKKQEAQKGGPQLTSFEVPADSRRDAPERRLPREPILDRADNPRGWPTRR